MIKTLGTALCSIAKNFGYTPYQFLNYSIVTFIFQLPDNQGITALHLSCLYGRKKIVEFLLNAGANLRSCDKAKTTPIHFTCVEGHIEVSTVQIANVESH